MKSVKQQVHVNRYIHITEEYRNPFYHSINNEKISLQDIEHIKTFVLIPLKILTQ